MDVDTGADQRDPLICGSSGGPQHERNRRTELSLFIEQEAALRLCNDHISLEAARDPSNLVWREKVCQWCYDVIDHLDASRDIVYVAMNILDRFCVVESSTKFSRDEKAYELAAMTGLFLALRLSGSSGLGAADIARMSRRGIKVQDIVKMGKSMIKKLSWERRLPTPLSFVRGFVALLPSSVNENTRRSLLDSASYLVEIAVCDSFFSGIAPSKVAFGAIVSASGGDGTRQINETERKELYNKIHEMAGLQRDSPELRAVRSRLHHIYTQSEDNNSGSPHVIPSSESETSGVLLSKPVSMRVVSSDNMGDKSVLSYKEVSLSSQVSNKAPSSLATVVVCEGSRRNKRSVSPPPQTEENTFKRTKRLRSS